jgi:hypothetical protein
LIDRKFKNSKINDFDLKTTTYQLSSLYELKPREYFTAPYSSKLHSRFKKFFDENNIGKTFLPKDRILLTYEILSRTSYIIKNDPLKNFLNHNSHIENLFGIERLLTINVFKEAFPLHEVLTIIIIIIIIINIVGVFNCLF